MLAKVTTVTLLPLHTVYDMSHHTVLNTVKKQLLNTKSIANYTVTPSDHQSHCMLYSDTFWPPKPLHVTQWHLLTTKSIACYTVTPSDHQIHCMLYSDTFWPSKPSIACYTVTPSDHQSHCMLYSDTFWPPNPLHIIQWHLLTIKAIACYTVTSWKLSSCGIYALLHSLHKKSHYPPGNHHASDF